MAREDGDHYLLLGAYDVGATTAVNLISIDDKRKEWATPQDTDATIRG